MTNLKQFDTIKTRHNGAAGCGQICEKLFHLISKLGVFMANPGQSGGDPVAYPAYCLLLMALTGLAQGLTSLVDSVDSDNSPPNAMGISAMTVNVTTDFAALTEAILTAKKNCDAAKNLVPAAGGGIAKEDPGLWIRCAFYLVEASTLLMGFGAPYAGEDLVEGSKQLTALSGQLDSTSPGDGWRGVSAQAYVDRVAAVRQSLDVLIYTDQWCADIAAGIAYFVNCVRLICGCLKAVLEVAYVLIRYCYGTGDIEKARGWDWNICRIVNVIMGLLAASVQYESQYIQSYFLEMIAEEYHSYCSW
ncbi:MAG: hypothetical protein K2Q25_05325 [Mycobacteriaceae bacterium]|nr:hypothetical protein [Mycobacteriaceae bacterium]